MEEGEKKAVVPPNGNLERLRSKSPGSSTGTTSTESYDADEHWAADSGMLFVDSEAKRGNWASSFQFIFSALGLTIGLGNIMRFTNLVFKHGGAPFVFAYLALSCLVGYPVFFLEVAIGQFSSRGPARAFRYMVPLLRGLGYAEMVMQFGMGVYYNSLVAWTAYFFISASDPAWADCPSVQSIVDYDISEICFDYDKFEVCNGLRGKTKENWFIGDECFSGYTEISGVLSAWDNCLRGLEIYSDPRKLHISPFCATKFKFRINSPHTRNFVLSFTKEERFIQLHDPCTGDLVLDYGEEEVQEGKTAVIDLSNTDKSSANVYLLAERFDNHLAEFNVHMYDWFRIHKFLNQIAPMICNGSTLSPPFRSMLNTAEDSWYQHIECMKSNLQFNHVFAPDLFFETVLGSGELEDLAGFYWPFPLCLALIWIIMLCFLVGGIRFIGKVVFLTSTLPIALLILLVVGGTIMPGFEDGFAFYLHEWEWCKLGDIRVWKDALSMSVFTLSCTGGGPMTLGSYNKFTNDILLHSLIVFLCDLSFSLVAGLGMFGIIGGIAAQFQMPIGDAMTSGSNLAFVTISQAALVMPATTVWAIFFFLAIFLLAASSSVIVCQSIIQFFMDEAPSLRRHKTLVVFFYCLVSFLLGLPGVTRGGGMFVDLFDRAIYEIGLVLCAFMELIAVSYFYGVFRFAEDVGMMLGFKKSLEQETASRLSKKRSKEEKEQRAKVEKKRQMRMFKFGRWVWKTPLRYFFVVTWAGTAPLGLLTLIFCVFYSNFSVIFPIVEFAMYHAFGFIAVVGVLMMGCGYTMLNDLSWADMIRPHPKWGPHSNAYKIGRYKIERKSKEGTSDVKLAQATVAMDLISEENSTLIE